MSELTALMACVALGAMCAALGLASALGTYTRRWQTGFSRTVESSLRQAYLFVDGTQLFRVYLLLLVLLTLAVLAWTRQPLMALLGLASLGAVPRAVLRVLHARRRKALCAQLPDVAMLMAGALRSGSSLVQALGQAARETPAPFGRELEWVMREQRLGASLDGSLQSLEARLNLDELKLMVAAIRIAQETGGNLAETLERLGETLRRKAVLEGKIDALTAQGRMQGWVMALLPVVIALALCLIEPQAMRPLYSTWQGGLFCLVLILFEGLGFFFIRRIVAIDV